MSDLKEYIGHVQFEGTSVTVRASSVADARKKIKEKLKKERASKYLDKKNFFIGEWH